MNQDTGSWCLVWIWIAIVLLLFSNLKANSQGYALEKNGVISEASNPVIVTRISGDGLHFIYGVHDSSSDTYRIFMRSLHPGADAVELAEINSSNDAEGDARVSVDMGYNPNTGQLVFASDENGDGLNEVYLVETSKPGEATKILDYDSLGERTQTLENQRIRFYWVDGDKLLISTTFGLSPRLYFIELIKDFSPVVSQCLVDGLESLGVSFGTRELFFKFTPEISHSHTGGNLLRAVYETGESGTVVSSLSLNEMRRAFLQTFESGRSLLYTPTKVWRFTPEGELTGTTLGLPDSIQFEDQIFTLDYPNEVLYPHGYDFDEQEYKVLRIDYKNNPLSAETLVALDSLPREGVVAGDGSLLAYKTLHSGSPPELWEIDTTSLEQERVSDHLDFSYTAMRGPRGFSNARALGFQVENQDTDEARIYYKNWNDGKTPVLLAEFQLSSYRGSPRLSHSGKQVYLSLSGTAPSIPNRLFVSDLADQMPGTEISLPLPEGNQILYTLNPRNYNGLLLITDDLETESANLEGFYWLDFNDLKNPELLVAPTSEGLSLEDFVSRADGNAFAFTTTNGVDEGYVLYYLKAGEPQWQWDNAIRLSPISHWYYSGWLGLFYREPFARYLYSNSMGWLFYEAVSEESVWLSHPELGWLWTHSLIFPYLFSPNTANWYYHYSDASAEGFFYDFSSGNWLNFPH